MLKPFSVPPHHKIKELVQDSKFEYFMNAVFYCIWRFQLRFSKFFEKIIYGFINFIGAIILPSRLMQKIYEREEAANEELERTYYGEKYGFCINKSKYFMYGISTGYFGAIVFLLYGIGLKIDNNLNDAIFMLIIVGTLIPGFRLLEWTVIDDYRYLRYFTEFKQNDAGWHRKWNRITILFCIGAILSTALGVASFFVILICL